MKRGPIALNRGLTKRLAPADNIKPVNKYNALLLVEYEEDKS